MLDNNMTSIKITKNDKFHRQIKYINIYHHFIKELMKQNNIFIDSINIKNMLADNFINPLKNPEFKNYQA